MTQAPLPSFKEQIAIVYNDYVETLGGGERSTLAYAKALDHLGFIVEIVSTRPIPSREAISRSFGEEYADLKISRIDTKDVYAYLKGAGATVFVNHTFMSFVRNPARLGIYSQMFPVTAIKRSSHPGEVEKLGSYQLMLSNSGFTKKYADALWEYPASRSHVLHPPIGSDHIKAAGQFIAGGVRKKRIFLNIGRFNPGTHNKNQKLIIEAFLNARREHPVLADWKLVLVGNANKDPESVAYFASCQEAARRSNCVEICSNASSDELKSWLDKAFGYVHGTGAFHPAGVDPFKCEHFGLSIVEAMAHGCIPLVYGRGGIFDLLTPGDMGIPYITPEGLTEGFAEVAELYDTDRGSQMGHKNATSAKTLDQLTFTAALAGFIAHGLSL